MVLYAVLESLVWYGFLDDSGGPGNGDPPTGDSLLTQAFTPLRNLNDDTPSPKPRSLGLAPTLDELLLDESNDHIPKAGDPAKSSFSEMNLAALPVSILSIVGAVFFEELLKYTCCWALTFGGGLGILAYVGFGLFEALLKLRLERPGEDAAASLAFHTLTFFMPLPFAIILHLVVNLYIGMAGSRRDLLTGELRQFAEYINTLFPNHIRIFFPRDPVPLTPRMFALRGSVEEDADTTSLTFFSTKDGETDLITTEGCGVGLTYLKSCTAARYTFCVH
jgi:hypothetical protein